MALLRAPRLLWLLVTLLLACGPAQAHRLGESYVFLNASETALSGRLEVTLGDLRKLFALDADGNGEISDAEFMARSGEINAYFQPRLSFFADGRPHPIAITGNDVRHIEIANYAMIHFSVPSLAAVPQALDVEYRFLFDGAEPSHRGLLVIQNNTRTGTVNNEKQVALIFGPGEERRTLQLAGTPWPQVFAGFVRHGIWHIWIGFDHILFIVALLLPSALVLKNGRWTPVDEFRSALWFVVRIVTLFTVAHTVTLSLAALGILRLPERLVEVVIAASIAVAALNNIVPVFSRHLWLVVLGFGFFHGFGFANVLSPLGLAQASLATSLLGFNLGVEIGQLAIICAVFPLLYAIRRWQPYRARGVSFGSTALIMVSLVWMAERIFNR